MSQNPYDPPSQDEPLGPGQASSKPRFARYAFAGRLSALLGLVVWAVLTLRFYTATTPLPLVLGGAVATAIAGICFFVVMRLRP